MFSYLRSTRKVVAGLSCISASQAVGRCYAQPAVAAAPTATAAAATPPDLSSLAGSWRVDTRRSDGVQMFLVESGLPWLVAKLADRVPEKVALAFPSPGMIHMTRSTAIFSSTERHQLDCVSPCSTPIGKSIAVWTWEQPKLVMRGPLPSTAHAPARVVEAVHQVHGAGPARELHITVSVIEHAAGNYTQHDQLLAALRTPCPLPGQRRLVMHRVCTLT